MVIRAFRLSRVRKFLNENPKVVLDAVEALRLVHERAEGESHISRSCLTDIIGEKNVEQLEILDETAEYQAID